MIVAWVACILTQVNIHGGDALDVERPRNEYLLGPIPGRCLSGDKRQKEGGGARGDEVMAS